MEEILEYSFRYGNREIGVTEKISDNIGISILYLYDKSSNVDYNIGNIANIIIYHNNPIQSRVDVELMGDNTNSAIMIVRDFLSRLPYANMLNYEELGLVTEEEKEIKHTLSRRLYNYEHGKYKPEVINVIAC